MATYLPFLWEKRKKGRRKEKKKEKKKRERGERVLESIIIKK